MANPGHVIGQHDSESSMVATAGHGVAVCAVDLCHGAAGAGTFAMEHAGACVVGGCEIVPKRVRQYGFLHPHVDTRCQHVVQYIQQSMPSGLAQALVCGPCQCFMTLGGSAGGPMGEHDPRECCGPVVEAFHGCPPSRRPATIVFENIPELESHDGGRFFARLCHVLAQMGYWLAKVPMRADHFHLPIRRSRLYFVALPSEAALARFTACLPTPPGPCLGGFATLSEKDPVLWDMPSLAVAPQAMRRALQRNSLGFFTIVSCHYRGVLQTLITRGGNVSCMGYGTYVVLTDDLPEYHHHLFTLGDLEAASAGGMQLPARILTCLECSRLQGCDTPTTCVFGEGNEAHTAWGEAVAIPCAKTVCQAALRAAGYAPQHPTNGSTGGQGWRVASTSVGGRMHTLEPPQL